MKKHELLQNLEMSYPSRHDWFISEENESTVTVKFFLDKKKTAEVKPENKFHVSYEVVTEESAEYGDALERGMISDNVCLRDAIQDLLSAKYDISSVEENDKLDPTWITVYYNMDPVYGGHFENRSLHLPRDLSLSSRQRIVKLIKSC